MQPRFLENFKTVDDIIKDYGISPSELDDAEILLAWYGDGCYCGDSLVIFRRDGKLYEVNGGHCSCYGLEGQWEPEETSVEALAKRQIGGGYDGADEADAELKELVRRLSSKKAKASSK